MYDVVVIGGGASGLTAAIRAAECGAGKIILLDKGARVGRKLSATGNGRGNVSNADLSINKFHSQSILQAEQILRQYGGKNARSFLRSLGLELVTEPNGRIYPMSRQATAVTDLLRFRVQALGIEQQTECAVTALVKTERGFSVSLSDDRRIAARSVVVACGGSAAPHTGSDGTAYKLLTNFGHELIKPLPSLVQLKTSTERVKVLRGLRFDAVVALNDGKNTIASARGDLIFADYGVTGSAVFDISGYAARQLCKGNAFLRFDFMPDMPQDELTRLLIERAKRISLPDGDFFTGVLNKQLGKVILSACRAGDFAAMASLIKSFELRVTATAGFSYAQTTAGGVCLSGFDDRLMSRLAEGLFACGEILDVDGDCGGYNLEWAWSSGLAAGQNAANYLVACQ